MTRPDIDAMTETPERQEATERLIRAGQALRQRLGPYACTHECQCGDCEAVSEWDAALAQMESNDG